MRCWLARLFSARPFTSITALFVLVWTGKGNPIIEPSCRKLYRKLAKFPPKSGVSCRTSCSWFLRISGAGPRLVLRAFEQKHGSAPVAEPCGPWAGRNPRRWEAKKSTEIPTKARPGDFVWLLRVSIRMTLPQKHIYRIAPKKTRRSAQARNYHTGLPFYIAV